MTITNGVFLCLALSLYMMTKYSLWTSIAREHSQLPKILFLVYHEQDLGQGLNDLSR